MAPDDKDEEPELEEAMAQLNLEPVPAMFEKSEDDKRQHLKALFLKGFVDGKVKPSSQQYTKKGHLQCSSLRRVSSSLRCCFSRSRWNLLNNI